MKDCISNIITIKEKTLKFSNDSYSNIFLFNENHYFDINLNDGTLNLQNFVDFNELILPSESTFRVGIKSEEGEFTQIEGERTSSTICSDLRIVSTRHTYSINIYTDEFKCIFVDLKRIYSGDEEVDLFDIYVNDNILNISAASLKQGKVSEAGILFFSQNSNIIPFVCSEANENKAHFKIDLSKLIAEDLNTFKGNLVFNSEIFPIHINKDTFFKAYIPSENGIKHSFFISSVDSLLNIEVRNEVIFEPTINQFSIEEDTVTLKGLFNSNLTINNIDLFNVELRLITKEANIPYAIDYNETEFKIVFNKEDFFNIKNTFSKKIKMKIILTAKKDTFKSINNKNILAKDVFSNIRSHLNTSTDHGFKQVNTEESRTNNFLAYSKDSSDSHVDILLETSLDKCTRLVIGNTIKISEIPYIRAKKDSIQIKFRSAMHLPKDKFSLTITSNDKTISASKIKVIGKKTFLATFKHSSESSLKGEEVFLLLDSLITKGMNTTITIEDRTYTQSISDVNELTVFKNTTDFITSTKKYQKLCSKTYKELFLKLPINKKRVLFENFLGNNTSSNPKFIYNHLVESGLDEEFELVWILNDTSEKIEGKHKVVKRNSLKYYYLMATSGYWIFNSKQDNSITKREGVTYVQADDNSSAKHAIDTIFKINK